MKPEHYLSVKKFWIALALLGISMLCSLGLLLMGGRLPFFLLTLIFQSIIFWQVLMVRPERYR